MYESTTWASQKKRIKVLRAVLVEGLFVYISRGFFRAIFLCFHVFQIFFHILECEAFHAQASEQLTKYLAKNERSTALTV